MSEVAKIVEAQAATTVAFAGEPGAFAEDAALSIFGHAPRVGLRSFRDVFEAVTSGAAAAGVVPIENVVNGTVRETYDLLLEYALSIVGEVIVPVRLSLAALPGQRLDDIERVYSHIQALGQAEAFLRRRPWSLLTTYNTAGAGKLIVERHETGSAAVLSPRAADLFRLEVLADDIQDVADNRTRFLVIARENAVADAGARRTTLVFGVRNEPGSLLRALNVFAERGVNLSRLESRPSRARAWEYIFWTDADGGADEPNVAAALDDLRAVTTLVRVLGSYPRATD
jgi:prephenate dehydratase